MAIRTTFWTDGHQTLNDEVEIKVKVLALTPFKPTSKYGDSGTRETLVIVESGTVLPRHWIERAIAESLSERCYCAHDCCGHWQRNSYVAQVPGKKRAFKVELHCFMNV